MTSTRQVISHRKNAHADRPNGAKKARAPTHHKPSRAAITAMFDQIVTNWKRTARRMGNFDYGDHVIVNIEMYDRLPTDQKSVYYEALLRLVRSKDKKTRDYGVALCVGFMVFGRHMRPPRTIKSLWKRFIGEE